MHVLWRGDTLQRMRLVSGLILFAFAATHFINHALGLISIDLMQVVQQWRWAVTRSWPGTIVLLAALLTHASLGLFKLSGRATLRLPRWELIQILLGISIPFLLLPHIVNTRIAHVFFNVNDIYVYELARLWPASAIIQSLLLVIVWVHGCMGIHFWLRLYAPLPAHLPATADAGRHHSAGGARRLCRRRQQRRRGDRNPIGARQSQIADALARARRRARRLPGCAI